jgi:serine/threonine protein kinase
MKLFDLHLKVKFRGFSVATTGCFDMEELFVGVDLNPRSAQALAFNVDAIGTRRGGTGIVKLLNFAYINLDKSQMLGSGSFSKVYRGAYKKEACAIKLIFTVDLTTDIIRRVCAEAEILSRFRVRQVLCHFLLLIAFTIAVCVYAASERCSHLRRSCVATKRLHFARIVCVWIPCRCCAWSRYRYRQSMCINRLGGIQWLRPDSHPFRRQAAEKQRHNQGGVAVQASYCGPSVPGLRVGARCPSALIIPVISFTCLCSCARGVAALHAYSRELCHRDIKSFNFLVDSQVRFYWFVIARGRCLRCLLDLWCLQFNAKLADLELGVTESGGRGSSKDRAAFEHHHTHTATNKQKRRNWSSFIMNVSSSGDTNDDLESGVSVNPAAGVLAADEFLANWAAPEVMNRLLQYRRLSVIYLH